MHDTSVTKQNNDRLQPCILTMYRNTIYKISSPVIHVGPVSKKITIISAMYIYISDVFTCYGAVQIVVLLLGRPFTVVTGGLIKCS